MAANLTVPVGDLEFHKDVPNCRFGYKDIETLADNIGQNGLLNPLLVMVEKPTRKGGKTRYYLVAGFRRFQAIQHLRTLDPKAFAKVPITRYEGSVEDALFANLIENVSRCGLASAEVAERVRHMKDKGIKQADIATRLGRGTAWVSTMLSVNKKATTKVKGALQKGQINFAAAKQIARLPDAEQDGTLDDFLSDGMRVADLKILVDKKLGEVRPTLRKVNEFKEKLQEVADVLDDTNGTATPKEKQKAAIWAEALCWATQVDATPASLSTVMQSVFKRQAGAQF